MATVSDEAAKVSSDDTMPGCSEFFVKFLFHVCCDILMVSADVLSGWDTFSMECFSMPCLATHCYHRGAKMQSIPNGEIPTSIASACISSLYRQLSAR